MASQEQLINELERLHKEFYDLKASKEYSVGTKICSLISAIKNHTLLSYLAIEIGRRKKARMNKKNPAFGYEYGPYAIPRPRIAVYSCITGGYDNAEIPRLEFNNVDYLLYSDNKNIQADGWNVLELPRSAMALNDNVLRNRYCKMHPSIVGKQYDFALYIDGNIRVCSDVSNMINAINPKTGLALHRHNVRNCIYDEYKALLISKRGVLEKAKKQVDYYEQNGFPRTFGLFEATIILSDLKNERSKNIMDAWWAEFLRSESKRDQLSLPYILWSMGYSIDDIGILGYDVMKNPKFRKTQHVK